MNERQLFQKYLAPTSPDPVGVAIARAGGSRLVTDQGQSLIDLIGGISVCNVGHAHPRVVRAIQAQADKYLHVMVYGEVIQSPQVQYASLLAAHLPDPLRSVYFTNSGAEAVEGAMKLAKRVTGRTEIIACTGSYHGSTQGALSLLGDEYWRRAFRPLLPDIRHVTFNRFESLETITERTAAIVLEPIQAEAGVQVPDGRWMQALRQRCTETGTLLILDEIQTGMGRTGKLWAFEHFDIVPDVLLSAKALGGGMPLGAFIADPEMMCALAHDPVLGHLTTFGGHPVCCAAGQAALEVILEEQLAAEAEWKGALFQQLLTHRLIRSVRGKGLMIAVAFDSFHMVQQIIQYGLRAEPTGFFTDWFLFAPDCIRIVPPLTISEDDIRLACKLILEACDQAVLKTE